MSSANGASKGAVSRAPEGYKRVKMVLAYNGADFRGLAPQPEVRTVVGQLGLVLQPFGDTIDLVMSGRTDAGVHGWGQVLSFDLPNAADLVKIQKSVNSRMGPEVVVRSLEEATPTFHARYDATGRHYRYRVLNTAVANPFTSTVAWHVPQPLDTDRMNEGAQAFHGQHDFSSFCRRPKQDPGEVPVTLTRSIRATQWTEVADHELLFEIAGSAFCHQMVRSIVGFLVAIGRGKRNPDDVTTVLEARDRKYAEPLAPPHGLTLWHVDY